MTRFALQTFTVRKYLKSPQAIDDGVRRIRETGLQAIELAYVKLEAPEMDAMAVACNKYGVAVGSSQITFDFLDKRRDWVLKFHEQLGCERTAVSVLPTPAILGGRDRLLRFAEQLEARGMPADLALLPIVESAFDPFAYSRGRASGLWQIIPGTGDMLGLKQNWWYDGRRDIVDSTRAALDYLEHLHDSSPACCRGSVARG